MATDDDLAALRARIAQSTCIWCEGKLGCAVCGSDEPTPDPRDARIAVLEAALRPFAEAARRNLIDGRMHPARRHHYSKMSGAFPLKVEVTVEQARDAMQAIGVGDLTAEQRAEIDAYLAREPS